MAKMPNENDSGKSEPRGSKNESATHTDTLENEAAVESGEHRSGDNSLAKKILSKTPETAENKEGGASSTSATDEEQADEFRRMGWIRLSLVSVALCLGMFIPSLDESIIATAIPRITSEFNSIDDIGWYGSAYLMSSSAFQFLFAQCYNFFHKKWVFMAAVAVFELGSLVCATAPSSAAFIVGRAIAGVGTAGAMSGVVNIVAQVVPLRHRAAYLGTTGAITALASLAAPVLGGTFADSHLTWRWCFWINLPIGGFTLLVTLLLLPTTTADTRKDLTWRQKLYSLDLFGTAIFLSAIVCLILALQFGGSVYSWANARTIVLLVLMTVLFTCFFIFERWMGENASVPTRVIIKKNVAFGALFVFLLDGGFYIMDYYLPIWFQAIKGKTAEQSGISTLPFIIALVITYLIVGYAVSAVGWYHPFMIASSIFATTGAGLLTTLRPSSGAGHYVGYQILFGVGVGLGSQLPVVAAQAVLAEADVSFGIAVIYFFQVLGPAIFLSTAESVFNSQLVTDLDSAAPGFNSSTLTHSGALGIVSSTNSSQTGAVVLAYNDAINQTWYMVVALAGLSLVGALGMQWKKLDQGGEGEPSINNSSTM